ncbi:hypothetical protein N0V82_002049 [Gnomoniopsis sp. IMI 355080]|nr:hypothetical protein N0V82_002049 [Gnomoniopsis sp. IMI 355080]
MQTATFVLALCGAVSALVARQPIVPNEPGLSLISYRPYCPVCDTVELNNNCLSQGASCMQTIYEPGNAPEACTSRCSTTCQQISYTANSDYGYSCNTTRTA